LKLIENERALFSDRKSFLFPPGMASDGVVTPPGQGFFVGFAIPVENRDAALFAEGGIGQHHLKTFAWVGEEAGGAKRTKGVR
jgi:hypothetical protein